MSTAAIAAAASTQPTTTTTEERPKSSWQRATNYKSILSRLIRDRYTSETIDGEEKASSVAEATTLDVDANQRANDHQKQQQQQQVYASHVDSLTPDVMARLSSGVNIPVKATTASAPGNDYQMDDIATCEDGLESDADDDNDNDNNDDNDNDDDNEDRENEDVDYEVKYFIF